MVISQAIRNGTRSQGSARGTTHLAYRPDIDGLRAVAVVSVLAFHAFPSAVPGGFVGVDVFFVISGFLISGIILSDIRTGTFTFAQFYSRRIRRIFPALILVLAATLAMGWLLLFPADFTRLGTHAAAGAAFVSNIALWRESGYFDTASELKPLLHLWSLGIEEQYYLVWPLLLVVGAAVLHRLRAVIIAIAVFSFVANIAMVQAHPSAAFYLPVTRFWELMIGSLLAYAQVFRPEPTATGSLAAPHTARQDVLALAGALLLAASLILTNQKSAFPGWWALLPTLGTASVIAAGRNAWMNRVLLSHRTAVYIGLISYPLYLWHWPLLTFARIVSGGLPSTGIRLLLLAVAGLLASGTYHLVERPIRKGTSLGWGRPVAIGLSAGMIALAAVAATAMDGWWKSVSARSPQVVEVSEAISDWEKSANGKLNGDTADAVMFFGDSHMQQYWPRIAAVMRGRRKSVRSVVFFAEGGCAPIPNVDRRGYQCKSFVDAGYARADQPDVSTVVVGASWPGLVNRTDLYQADEPARTLSNILAPDEEWVLEGFADQLARLRAGGKRVILVLSSPRSDTFDPNAMLHRKGLWHWKVDLSGPLPRKAHEAFRDPIDRRLREIARRVGAETIDPTDWLCSSESCPAVDLRGRPRYKDFSHLRASLVRDGFTAFDDLIYRPAAPDAVGAAR